MDEEEKDYKSSFKIPISESSKIKDLIPFDEIELIKPIGDFSNSGGVLDIAKSLDKGEHMLPVHFLPEGRKAYDWIDKDLKNDALMEEKKSRYRTL